MVSMEMPLALENLFAVADGIEGRRARADGADAQAPQAFDHAADAGEPVQILRGTVRSPALQCGGW